jgi:hypothetical protein
MGEPNVGILRLRGLTGRELEEQIEVAAGRGMANILARPKALQATAYSADLKRA